MKIYKYRSSECKYLEALLTTGEFHFSAWNEMNDPMEGFFRYYDQEHTENEMNQIIDEKSLIKICCFSMDPDDMLLWSHYSNNHKGVCIEVDTDSSVSEGVSFTPVRYKNDIQFLKNPDGSLREVKSLLSYKLTPWVYEQEIRAFIQGAAQNTKVGTITRVIVGINASDETKEMVERARQKYSITQAKFDFDQSKILV